MVERTITGLWENTPYGCIAGGRSAPQRVERHLLTWDISYCNRPMRESQSADTEAAGEHKV